MMTMAIAIGFLSISLCLVSLGVLAVLYMSMKNIKSGEDDQPKMFLPFAPSLASLMGKKPEEEKADKEIDPDSAPGMYA